LAISIHPYLTGVPHRIGYLEALYGHILAHDDVVMWTGAEILDCHLQAIVGTNMLRADICYSDTFWMSRHGQPGS
jgi:hypothetical protein